MLSLNLEKLNQNLKDAECSVYEELDGGVKYLYEALFIPFISGKEVLVRDIDFGCFDDFDLEAFKVFYQDSCERKAYDLISVAEVICKSSPKARHSKAFF